jgi:hypothetical protein
VPGDHVPWQKQGVNDERDFNAPEAGQVQRPFSFFRAKISRKSRADLALNMPKAYWSLS